MNATGFLGALRRRKAIRSRSAPLGWRRLTIGLGIGSQSLRAVGVSGSTVRWKTELQREDGDSLEEALSTLFARCPLQQQPRVPWMRPQVVAAVGPSLVQVKRLSGLPLLQDPVALSAVIREGAGRFFLKNGVPLRTSDVSVTEPGTAWAAAFEAPVVEQLQRVCADAGLTLRAIVPAAITLGQVAPDGELTWTDGCVQAELTYREHELASIRQLRASGDSERLEAVQPLSPHAALESLGDNAMHYADAYGAARVEFGARLVLSASSASRVGASSRTRLRIAATALCVSVVAALLLPPLLAVRSAASARARLTLIAPEVRKARRIERELGQVSSTLERVSEFAAERRSVTALLERITAALPDHAAIVTLELDSARGTMVALAPRASQVTDALERVSGVASPQVVGPITPVTTRVGVVERVTVRFWLEEHAQRGNAAGVGNPAQAPEGTAPPAANGAVTPSPGGLR